MKFRPLHDRVLVRRVEAEEKTAGGIIIPDTAKEKPQEGEHDPASDGAFPSFLEHLVVWMVRAASLNARHRSV